MRWEYKTLTVEFGDDVSDRLQYILDGTGLEGWELVSVCRGSAAWRLFFKRSKQKAVAKPILTNRFVCAECGEAGSIHGCK